MNQQLKIIFDESIKMEKNISKIYRLFSEKFSVDKQLWWNLSLEEINHASLIESGRDFFQPLGMFPQEILTEHIGELKDFNIELDNFIHNFDNIFTYRKKAFEEALNFESLSGEKQFAKFLEIIPKENKLIAVFQKLANQDISHIKRINEYIIDNKI